MEKEREGRKLVELGIIDMKLGDGAMMWDPKTNQWPQGLWLVETLLCLGAVKCCHLLKFRASHWVAVAGINI